VDNTLVIVALVGLALVCLGVLFVAFVMLLRFAGSRPMGLLSMLLGDRDEARESRIVTTPKPDLRAIAQANDFDAALAKHVVQDEIEPHIVQRTPITPTPSADQLFGEPPKLARRESDRPTPRRDGEDDMFDDFLG
jgi:hypothetical protein